MGAARRLKVTFQTSIRSWALSLALIWQVGCAPPTPTSEAGEETLTAAGVEREASVTPTYLDDLDAILERGYIRFGRQTWAGFDSLPREGLPLDHYYQLAEDFALRHRLEVRWVDIDDFVALLASAANGQVDVVVNNITITDARKLKYSFTLPLTYSEEWLIGRAGLAFDSLSSRASILGLPEGTAYLETFASTPELQSLELARLSSGLLPDEVVDGIGVGDYDLTLMDAGSARYLVERDPAVSHLWTAPELRQLAWVLRPENDKLETALNQFLTEQLISGRRDAVDRQDLAGIKSAGTLRMLTITGPHTFFLWRGELLGFEYELLEQFAEEQGLRLEVVVAPDRASLFPYLQEGRADVLAAAVTITDARVAEGYHFTDPYMFVDEVVVTASTNPVPQSLADLADRVVYLNPATSHWQTLTRLGVPMVAVNDGAEAVLNRVRQGEYDVTVADSHILAIEQAYDEGLSKGLVVTEKTPIAWVIHPQHVELKAALDDFTKRYYRGLTYNLLWQKYFGNERRVRRREKQRIVGTQLSPYDDLVREHISEYDLDWRIVVAQMYQESMFDPKRTSFAGARGLLQVMPRTATQVGVDPDSLWEPDVNVQAGLRYLDWTHDRFEDSLPLSERLWFSLAAYNAGPGHVRDARRLARQRGLNPDVWFNNVEQAMLLLSQPEFNQQARHGFVRGSEPVNYVREIRERYRVYVDHFNTLEAGTPDA